MNQYLRFENNIINTTSFFKHKSLHKSNKDRIQAVTYKIHKILSYHLGLPICISSLTHCTINNAPHVHSIHHEYLPQIKHAFSGDDKYVREFVVVALPWWALGRFTPAQTDSTYSILSNLVTKLVRCDYYAHGHVRCRYVTYRDSYLTEPFSPNAQSNHQTMGERMAPVLLRHLWTFERTDIHSLSVITFAISSLQPISRSNTYIKNIIKDDT